MQVGIVAHVSRADRAADLQKSLNADVLSIDDAAWFSLWESTRRCAENHMRVLSDLHCMAVGGEWCVVLEDDCIPVPCFRTEAAAALDCAPTPLVGFYLGQGNPSGEIQRSIRRALDVAEAWITADYFISAVGYAIRADMIPSLLNYIKPPARDEEIPLRITKWSQEIGLLTSYTHPSLVNHADIESTIYPGIPVSERMKLPRVAWEWGTRKNWRTGAVRLDQDPKWSKA